jgi:hypothetical protein
LDLLHIAFCARVHFRYHNIIEKKAIRCSSLHIKYRISNSKLDCRAPFSPPSRFSFPRTVSARDVGEWRLIIVQVYTSFPLQWAETFPRPPFPTTGFCKRERHFRFYVCTYIETCSPTYNRTHWQANGALLDSLETTPLQAQDPVSVAIRPHVPSVDLEEDAWAYAR